MPRLSKWNALPDGQVSLRVNMPAAIVKLVEELAEINEMPRETALKMLLNEIAAKFEEGDAMFLSSSFQKALRQVREKHFGLIGSNTTTVDFSKLHQSNKTKSGFEGVYANGKGFRAQGRTSAALNKPRHLGTYPTAEEAAWRRYCHYKEKGIPYGLLESEVERFREDEPNATDLELTLAVLEHSKICGNTKDVFGENFCNVPEEYKDALKGFKAENVKMKPAGFASNNIPEHFNDENLPDI